MWFNREKSYLPDPINGKKKTKFTDPKYGKKIIKSWSSIRFFNGVINLQALIGFQVGDFNGLVKQATHKTKHIQKQEQFK